jgi:hypothetical protein
MPPGEEIGVTSFPVCKQSLITRKRCRIEQKLQLTTNTKSGSAFQNPHLHFRCDATWRRNRRDVISVCKQSLITRKRCEIEENLLLTTNIKSGRPFRIHTYILGATPRGVEIGVTSFPVCKPIYKAYNSETV